MRIVDRVTLLGCFAAAGLGLAVYLAASTGPQEDIAVVEEPGRIAADEDSQASAGSRPVQPDRREVKASSPSVQAEANFQRKAPSDSDRDRKDSPAEAPAGGGWLRDWALRSGRSLGRETDLRDSPPAGREPPPGQGPGQSPSAANPTSAGAAPSPSFAQAAAECLPRSEVLGVRVYRPRHVTPAELRTLIEPLLTARVGLASLSPSLEVGDGAPSRDGAARPAATVVVVRDCPAALERIDGAVAGIDVPESPIEVQAAVVAVRLGEGRSLGVDFELLRERNSARPILPWSAASAGAPSAVLAASGGLKCALLEGSLATLLTTLDSFGAASLIAVPRLKLADGTPAEISLSETPSAAGATDAERAPAGPRVVTEAGRLWLRPHASADGSIYLEIALRPAEQPSAAVAAIPSSPATDPPTAALIVPEGAAVVFGGMTCGSADATPERVPWFERLPTLRRSAPTSREKSGRCEMLVVLTAQVAGAGAPDGEQASGERPSDRRQAEDSRKPIAQRYFRAAGNALAGGDPGRALRLVETALCFDPVDRAAIDFRNRLWLSAAARRLPREVVQASAQTSLDSGRTGREEVTGSRPPGRTP